MQQYRIKGRTLQALKPGSIASYYDVAIVPRQILRKGTEAVVAWHNARGRS